MNDNLSRAIAAEIAAGGRIESQTETSAVVVTGQKVNHVLHLLISLFTVGLWVIVWIVMASKGGERRTLLTVDENGEVRRSAPGFATQRSVCGKCGKPLSPMWKAKCNHCGGYFSQYPPVLRN